MEIEKEATKTLGLVLVHDRDEEVRLQAAVALLPRASSFGRFEIDEGVATDTLRKLLQEGSEEVQLQAAVALLEHDEKDPVEVLRDLMHTGLGTVKVQAAVALLDWLEGEKVAPSDDDETGTASRVPMPR